MTQKTVEQFLVTVFGFAAVSVAALPVLHFPGLYQQATLKPARFGVESA